MFGIHAINRRGEFKPIATNENYKRRWQDKTSNLVKINSEIIYPFDKSVIFCFQIQKNKSDKGKYPSGLQIKVIKEEPIQVILSREIQKGKFFYESNFLDYEFLSIFPYKENYWLAYKIVNVEMV